jgi:hypothetical protein
VSDPSGGDRAVHVAVEDDVLGPTGVLVNANDTWVTDVRARKTEAPDSSQEGADIAVSWPDRDAYP